MPNYLDIQKWATTNINYGNKQYIIDRRDLLVPQNIQEIKGSFFTPAIWVEKSQEYIEKA
jgi:hypothetical protein